MQTKNPLKETLLQYLEYNAVGLFNGLIDIASLNLFLLIWPTKQGPLIMLFNTMASGLAMLNSYIWNSRITFRKGKKRGYQQKFFFVIQGTVSLTVSNFILFLGIMSLKELPLFSHWFVYNAAKGISMFCASTSSFLLMKFFVFRMRGNGNKEKIT